MVGALDFVFYVIETALENFEQSSIFYFRTEKDKGGQKRKQRNHLGEIKARKNDNRVMGVVTICHV